MFFTPEPRDLVRFKRQDVSLSATPEASDVGMVMFVHPDGKHVTVLWSATNSVQTHEIDELEPLMR